MISGKTFIIDVLSRINPLDYFDCKQHHKMREIINNRHLHNLIKLENIDSWRCLMTSEGLKLRSQGKLIISPRF
jgi:hypothetical protein